MPRKPRLEVISPNTLYHIVCRGNNQRRIFRSVRDYKKFLKILRETKKKYPFYLYSHNLLPNHFHFEVETIEVPISKIMHQVNNAYVKYFRKRYGGTGHLFQDRFYSSLINKDSYLWEASCYIDLNAVRAGLVKRPEDYRWSSYLIYCQKTHDDNLVDREKFLRYGGEDLEASRLAYLNFVEERLNFNKRVPLSR